jgi:hypothetical protein
MGKLNDFYRKYKEYIRVDAIMYAVMIVGIAIAIAVMLLLRH